VKDGEIRGGARGLQVQILPEGVRFEDRVESAYEREGEAGNVSCEVEEERSSKYCRDLKRASCGEWNKQEDVEEFT